MIVSLMLAAFSFSFSFSGVITVFDISLPCIHLIAFMIVGASALFAIDSSLAHQIFIFTVEGPPAAPPLLPTHHLLSKIVLAISFHFPSFCKYL